MAVFEELGRRITQTGQEAFAKTKGAAEALKLNNQIAEAERAVSAYCDIIGRAYYAKYSAGGWDPDFDEMFVGIEGEKEKIADYRIQLRAMRGVVECPGCGRELAIGMNFCSHCGAKLMVPEPVKTEEAEAETEPETADEQEEPSGDEKTPDEMERE